MGGLQEVEKLLPTLTRTEKAQLLQQVARELGDAILGIENTVDVCGGVPCIVRTRIPVWVLEQYRQQGATEAELLHAYPALRTEDLVNAWAYVHSHQEEIARQIQENEAA